MGHISNVKHEHLFKHERCKEKSNKINMISFELHIKAEHNFIFYSLLLLL